MKKMDWGHEMAFVFYGACIGGSAALIMFVMGLIW